VANSLGSNPWVLDTPGGGIVYQDDIRAAHFEWTGFAANATITVQDRFAKVIWAPVAPAAPSEAIIESFTMEWLHGLNLVTMTSGVLRVYFK
jgi:hypothetical protein